MAALMLVVLGAAYINARLARPAATGTKAPATAKSADRSPPTAGRPAKPKRSERVAPGPGDDGPGAAVAAKPPPPAKRTDPKPPNPNPPAATGKPSRPASGIDGPWRAAMEAGDAARHLEDVAFDDFDLEASRPRREDVEAWFARVPGQRWTLADKKSRSSYVAAFDGVARLKMPWRQDVALRLSLDHCSRLLLHLYHGLQGVTLAYYPEDHRQWAAYLTTRRAGQAVPEAVALAATDQLRAWRTGMRQNGTFALRCAEGEVVLSRGDIVLLRAPLEQTPDEVYLDAKAEFNGIEAVLTQGLPKRQEPFPVAFDTDRPAELPWTEHLAEGAKFERLSDGSVALSSDRADQASWVVAPMPRVGLHQLVFQIDGASAGAGVFLGHEEDGRPVEIVRFVRHRRTGQLCAAARDDSGYEDDYGSISERIVPLAGARVWVRLLFASQSLRWWISADGRNWAMPQMPWSYRPERGSHVGLHCVAGAPGCRIRLRRVQLQRLPTFSALADASPLARVPASLDADDLGTWLQRVAETRPKDVDLDAWCRACAIRTLSVGAPRVLQMQLVERLLDEAAERKLPLEQQRALLGEAGLLLDLRDDHGRLMSLVQRYHELGMTAYRRTGALPYRWVRRCLMTVPMATPYDFRVVDPRNIRAELIQLVYDARWDEARQLCRQLRFFGHFEQVPLAAWAEAVAPRTRSRGGTPSRTAPRKDDWAHPLVEQLSKDAYNALAELQAVRDSGSTDDTAQFIASLDAELAEGVAPFGPDRQLLVSIPSAVRLMLASSPELRARLAERYGQVASLRVHQAIERGDASAARLATIQFAGSQAAAEAHLWLGDRALSSGWSQRALSEYRRALESSGVGMQAQLEPRLQLASAMAGVRLPEPVAGEVTFGDIRLSGAEFQRLTSELVQQRHLAGGPSVRGAAVSESVPKPTGLEVRRRGRIDGPGGEQPDAGLIPRAAQFDVDWVGRQIAVTVANGLMYLSNRFHVAAYDLATGSRRWLSQRSSGKMLRSQQWGLIRMRPLVTERRVFARLLYGRGPSLVCLDRDNGQCLWTAEAPGNAQVVADPLMIQGRLVVLTMVRRAPSDSVLGLTVVDPESGRFLYTHELLRLRPVWWRRSCCEATPLADGLVAVLAGVTVCADLSGSVRWVRKHTALPPAEEPGWVQQHFQRPLVFENQLYVAQPGVRSVQRLDVASGHQRWCAVLPDVQRLVGVSAGGVIVQVAGGLAALDRDTGKTLWRRPIDQLLDVGTCDEQAVLCIARTSLDDDGRRKALQVLWLDPATGARQGATQLKGLEGEKPLLGPVVLHDGHMWAFWGRNRNDPAREMVELTPSGQPDEPPADQARTTVWD